MASPFDLLGAWREAVTKLEQDLNSGLTGVAGDERFSRTMNGALSLFARLQAAQAEATEKALARANLPSRADFRDLHKRLDAIEAQIASVAQAVDTFTRASGHAPARPDIPQPARTRKPPGAAAPPVEAKPPEKPAHARKARKSARPRSGAPS